MACGEGDMAWRIMYIGGALWHVSMAAAAAMVYQQQHHENMYNVKSSMACKGIMAAWRRGSEEK